MRILPDGKWSRAVVLVLLIAAPVGLACLDLARTGRARPPLAERDAAERAVAAARQAAAVRWAPSDLAAADEALRAALLEWSRQGARLLPLRDFRPAAAAFGRAEALALAAGRRAQAARAEGQTAAEGAIREALALEAQARGLVGATTLPHGQRVRLQQALLRVHEAEALLRYGEIDAARESAEGSRADLGQALDPVIEAAGRYTSRRQIATWRRWVDDTRAWSRATGQFAIVVLKEKNTLVLLSGGSVAGTYPAEVGANAIDVKRRQGDRATPEGRYRIVAKKRHSRFHRALLLDYPNAADRARFAAAQRRGEVPRGARIGGLIEIHGEGGRDQNWTDGCVALSNRDMDALYARVSEGARVTIVGGDGSDGTFSGALRRMGEAAGAEHER